MGAAPVVVEAWGSERAGDVAALVGAALPGEELSVDELVACLWDDPAPDETGAAGVVLVATEGERPVGVAAAVSRRVGDAPDQVPMAWLKLVAVAPDARRRGVGHALLDAVEQWSWDRGATELHVAGAPPFYLWPGVDATATEALCLFESRGYRDTGCDVNMVLDTGFRADPPEGVTVRRVLDDADVERAEALIAAHWPEWLAEARRAIEHGCCHLALVAAPGDAPTAASGTEGEQAVGFVCHSVSRAGWLGPMGTDPTRRQGGVGSALVSAVCRDLQIAELPTVEICWVGPARFYAKNGATISRAFRQFRLRRPR